LIKLLFISYFLVTWFPKSYKNHLNTKNKLLLTN